jgi:MFS family permease
VTALAARAAGAAGLLRDRDFRLLWIGESVSSVGSAVTVVALPLVAVSELHASAFAVSSLVAAAWLPWLVLGLPAGAYVDRLPRRPVMIAADLVSLAAFAAIPLAAAFGVLTVPQLVASALVAGVAKVFFSTALRAYLPSLVAPPDRLEANAKLQGTEQAANFVGPALAGLLAAAASALGGLLVDATTFLVSAVCLLRIESREQPVPVEQRRLRSEIAAGLRLVVHDELLLRNTLFGCVANLALIGYSSLLVVFLVRHVGLSAGATGMLLAVTSLGGVAGAAVARRIAERIGSARAVLLCKVGAGPLGLLIPLAGTGLRLVPFVIGSLALIGGIVAGNVVASGWIQTYVPPELMGRVSASMQVVNLGAMPLGALLAGALATAVGVAGTMWAMLGLFAASGLILATGPLRRLRDLPAGSL